MDRKGTAKKNGLFFFSARKRQTPVMINNETKANKLFPPLKESANTKLNIKKIPTLLLCPKIILRSSTININLQIIISTYTYSKGAISYRNRSLTCLITESL